MAGEGGRPDTEVLAEALEARDAEHLADQLAQAQAEVVDLRAQAGRLAHVLMAVQQVIGSPVVQHDAVTWAFRTLRQTIADALDTQQLTDPYGLAAVLEGENAQLREALRRIRDLEDSTDDEDTGTVRLADEGRVCDHCCAVEIAAATLAELDPLAPEPDGPPGRPLTVVDVPLPAPRCATCGDTGYVQPRAGHPYETCDCSAGQYWSGAPAPDDGERPVVTLALPPLPEEG